jgi:hypothetical protein
MATPHATLTQLAQQAAAQIGFTVRRWWRDTTKPDVLRVEVERRLVGAPPAIAELTVAIPHKDMPRKEKEEGPRATSAATSTSPKRTRTTPPKRTQSTTRAKRPVRGGRATRARKT